MIDSIPLDSNGPAYQRREVREGPPLDYVADKLRHSLESLHELVAIESGDELRPAQTAFHYALVAYLASNSMLAAANAPFFSERLARQPRAEFEQWLDAIDRGDSVTGLAL